MWGSTIDSDQETVDGLDGVSHHPLQDGRFGIDFGPDPPLECDFCGSQLLFELSHCAFGQSIRLWVVPRWIFRYNVHLGDLFHFPGHFHESWLSVGLQL